MDVVFLAGDLGAAGYLCGLALGVLERRCRGSVRRALALGVLCFVGLQAYLFVWASVLGCGAGCTPDPTYAMASVFLNFLGWLAGLGTAKALVRRST